MYSVDDTESFNRVDSLKRDIEKHFKEKREVVGFRPVFINRLLIRFVFEVPLIVVVGNKSDLEDKRVVDKDFALTWGQREKGLTTFFFVFAHLICRKLEVVPLFQ